MADPNPNPAAGQQSGAQGFPHVTTTSTSTSNTQYSYATSSNNHYSSWTGRVTDSAFAWELAAPASMHPPPSTAILASSPPNATDRSPDVGDYNPMSEALPNFDSDANSRLPTAAEIFPDFELHDILPPSNEFEVDHTFNQVMQELKQAHPTDPFNASSNSHATANADAHGHRPTPAFANTTPSSTAQSSKSGARFFGPPSLEELRAYDNFQRAIDPDVAHRAHHNTQQSLRPSFGHPRGRNALSATAQVPQVPRARTSQSSPMPAMAPYLDGLGIHRQVRGKSSFPPKFQSPSTPAKRNHGFFGRNSDAPASNTTRVAPPTNAQHTFVSETDDPPWPGHPTMTTPTRIRSSSQTSPNPLFPSQPASLGYNSAPPLSQPLISSSSFSSSQTLSSGDISTPPSSQSLRTPSTLTFAPSPSFSSQPTTHPPLTQTSTHAQPQPQPTPFPTSTGLSNVPLPRGAWTPHQISLAISYFLSAHHDSNIRGEERFAAVSRRLLADENIVRTPTAVKNMWNRVGRDMSGFDERRAKRAKDDMGKRVRKPLATSLQGRMTGKMGRGEGEEVEDEGEYYEDEEEEGKSEDEGEGDIDDYLILEDHDTDTEDVDENDQLKGTKRKRQSGDGDDEFTRMMLVTLRGTDRLK